MIESGGLYAVGPHRLLCGDLEAGDFRRLEAELPVEASVVVYCDPPWDEVWAARWRRLAGRSRPVDSHAFNVALCHAIQSASPRVAFVEQSAVRRKWRAVFLDVARAAGLRLTGEWATRYGSEGVPNVVYRFGKGRGPELTGLGGAALVRRALEMEVQPGDVVLDPCIGLGGTAKAGQPLGGAVFGMDLNPARLQVTADWLARKTGDVLARID